MYFSSSGSDTAGTAATVAASAASRITTDRCSYLISPPASDSLNLATASLHLLRRRVVRDETLRVLRTRLAACSHVKEFRRIEIHPSCSDRNTKNAVKLGWRDTSVRRTIECDRKLRHSWERCNENGTHRHARAPYRASPPALRDGGRPGRRARGGQRLPDPRARGIRPRLHPERRRRAGERLQVLVRHRPHSGPAQLRRIRGVLDVLEVRLPAGRARRYLS